MQPTVDLMIAVEYGTFATCALEGSFDVFSESLLQEAVEDLIAEGEAEVALDLTEVDYVDAAGLKRLARSAQYVRSRGGHAVAIVPDPTLAECLQRVRIDRVLPVCRTRDEAERALRAAPTGLSRPAGQPGRMMMGAAGFEPATSRV
jgi:anti-anti-sigma factor